METATDPFGPPTRMGRYELLFRIAAGGMAEVYAARVHGEAGFQKLVAVKRMLPTLADDEEFVTMFLDEARVAANISSPNVVQTLDLGRDNEGALYIAMELVVGVTLSRIMKEAAKVRRAVPVPMAIELLAQSANGLHAAHEATTPIGQPLHIVHRDVSPQNILVGVDGRARLTDFGVARAVLRSTKTDAGRIKGKFAYCAPEQLRSEGVDRRADIFALGVVAWEALAGQRLFVADHPLATMERVANMPILPLHQVRSRVPEGVASVVEKALQRDVGARYETAHEFAMDLRQAGRDAGLTLPTQGEVSTFIKAAGGEPLKKMRSNIKRALAGGPAAVVPSVDDQPTIISTTGTNDTDVLDGARVSLSEPDASGVARIPGSLLPGAVAVPPQAPAGKRPISRGMQIAIAVGLAVVVGVSAGLLITGESETATAPPPAADAVPEEAAPAPAPAPTPEAPEAVDLSGAAGENVVVDEEPENVREESEAVVESEDVPATRRRRRRRRTSPAASPPVAEMNAPTVTNEAPMVAAPMAPPRMSQPVEMAPARMGPLVGLEDFDRDLRGR
ncbi:MAG: serine/threonine-protein kinase [Myxococcota bacterium]